MTPRIGIVGASVAGLFSASRLARAGQEVRVYERAEEFSPDERSLIVTHRYSDLLGEVGRGAIRTEVRHFELFADGRVAGLTLSKPDLIIERAVLIKDLASSAESAGANLSFGHRFRSFGETTDGVVMRFGDNGTQVEEKASVVVGADGASSRVARAAGWEPQPTVSLLQAIVGLPSDYPDATVRVWFRPEDTPFFYWLIPDGPGRGALGVIGEGSQTRAHLDAFLAEKRFEPRSYQAAMIPEYKRWVDVHRPLGKGDIYLVGDAAGQVKISTVGGIVTGLRGAVGVTDLILRGSKKELHRLRRELGLHLMIHKALRGFSQDEYIYLLDQFDPRVERAMTVASRDQAARIIWSLLRYRPQILMKGIRRLLLRG